MDNLSKEFFSGIWKQNPVFYFLIGMCPTLAVTNSLINSLAISLVVIFVLLCSNICASSIRQYIPAQARITVFVIVTATFVTFADIFLKSNFPVISRELGPYVPLVAVNCIIISSIRASVSKDSVLKSMTGALGTGIGYLFALVILGSVRELAGTGKLLGYYIFGSGFKPLAIMALPAGAFLTLGLLTGFYNLARKKND